LLKDNNFNLEELINPKDSTSVTSYGLEFKDVKLLQKLLHLHPRWKAMEEHLTKGAKFPIQEID
jgi:hypothetical protein